MGGGHSKRNPEGGGTRRMSRTTKLGGSGARNPGIGPLID
jgi:hypothetical protein